VVLSPAGEEESFRLAALLAERNITHLFHSGLRRTSFLAEIVAQERGIPAVTDSDLRERDFGTWELRCWNDIYAEVGSAMEGLLLDPSNYSPPGGETTFALRNRVLRWYGRLPSDGLIVAITHGGPIAALRGALTGLATMRWAELIPAFGSITELA
jgi:broad specificity phosphatase PhoE